MTPSFRAGATKAWAGIRPDIRLTPTDVPTLDVRTQAYRAALRAGCQHCGSRFLIPESSYDRDPLGELTCGMCSTKLANLRGMRP